MKASGWHGFCLPFGPVSLAEVHEAYRFFGNRLDGVLKVAITP